MIVFRLRCFPLLTTNYDCTVGTSRYALIDVVGRGAYGVVCAARDELGGSGSESLVAIKKINNAFEHAVYTKRTLREIRLLRLLSHKS